MVMRKQVVILLVILLSVTLYTFSAHAAEPIRIGSPLLLSGTGAYVGGAEKDTLEMMAADLNKAGGINGRPIEFIFYDEEGKPDVAVSMVKRLIQKDKVSAIVGISTSWTALPIIPIVEKDEIPTIILAAAIKIVDPVKKWVFKTPADDRIVTSKLLSYMQSQGIKRIALMSTQDGFGDGGRSEITAQAPSFGISIVFDDKYTMQDTDITPTLSKIKKTDAQAVINWSSQRAPIILTMNYRQIGLDLPLYQSHAAFSKDFLDATGKNSEGVKTAAMKFYGAEKLPDSDPQKKVILGYQEAYKKKYGKETNQFGGCALDGFNILVAALKKAGDDKNKLRDAIEQTKGYVGIHGVFNYSPTDHGGISKDSILMYQAAGGTWNIIK
ncbi:MAG: ABC transporter substrate-binding protein [Deltaproteobacteria bacterium]|nr:ABC transporter substrate-binding protein [Deltaproteobacteria bacterium]